MDKILIFTKRLFIFIFSYFLYLVSVFFIFINLKLISKICFTYAAYCCFKSFGVTFKFNKNVKSKLRNKGIHISNHDNPLDIFLAQFLFRMPTITTVDKHLAKILPFFEISIRNYGHFTFDHLNFKHRKSAYIFLKKICRINKSVLIYPSGSIYTSIDKRFSKSISKLSMDYRLNVICWDFGYSNSSGKNYIYKKNVFKYILERFFSEKIEVYVKKVKVFCPGDFSSEYEYHDKLKSFYINN